MSPLSQRPSETAYYIEDWRISRLPILVSIHQAWLPLAFNSIKNSFDCYKVSYLLRVGFTFVYCFETGKWNQRWKHNLFTTSCIDMNDINATQRIHKKYKKFMTCPKPFYKKSPPQYFIKTILYSNLLSEMPIICILVTFLRWILPYARNQNPEIPNSFSE